MTAVRPDFRDFLWWWGLEEAGGNSRIDYVNAYVMAEVNSPVARAVAHSSPYGADMEFDSSNALTASQEAWNTFGNESKTFCVQWKMETFQAAVGNSRVLFSKFDKDNDKEYGLWFYQTRPFGGIARGGHAWEAEPYGGTGTLAIGNFYLSMLIYDAENDVCRLKIWNTNGNHVAADGTGVSAVANSTGFGSSADDIHLNLGSNTSGGDTSWKLDGMVDEFFCYDGVFTSEQEEWIVNGGAFRRYNELLPAGLAIAMGINF